VVYCRHCSSLFFDVFSYMVVEELGGALKLDKPFLQVIQRALFSAPKSTDWYHLPSISTQE